ncbi:MAG: hypothetical protein HQK51_15680, partial [Oligoflexia bacterium]|nr:hypothetical protein [Oligoflexia bacterium]
MQSLFLQGIILLFVLSNASIASEQQPLPAPQASGNSCATLATGTEPAISPLSEKENKVICNSIFKDIISDPKSSMEE